MNELPRQSRRARSRARLRPLAWAVLCAVAGPAALAAQPAPPPAQLTEPQLPGGSDAPVTLQADSLSYTLDQDAEALGNVYLEQAGLVLTAQQLRYLSATQTVRADGSVQVTAQGSRLSGSRATLSLLTHAGQVDDASYFLARTGGGGRASTLRFVGTEQLQASDATYSACRVSAPGEDPDWELSADHIALDFPHNEGRAEGAVLRFLGMPILGAPVLSFAATDARKSGWLPPSVNLDNRAGLDLSLPYYLNLAPNYDATLTPGIVTRRGVDVQGQGRWLFPWGSGTVDGHWMPRDRQTGISRHSVALDTHGAVWGGGRYAAAWQQASDDAYWKDFSGILPSLTPRLLPQDVSASYAWQGRWPGWGAHGVSAYARVQRWQVLQTDTPLAPPYSREPQVGVQGQGALPFTGGAGVGVGARPQSQWRYEWQAEVNRFVLLDAGPADTRPGGSRAHAQGAVFWQWDNGWLWATPRLAANAASYRTDTPMLDGRSSARRLIPTASLDLGMRLRRSTSWFGTALTQTLEPRLHAVYTPYQAQETLPLFDTAPLDFNELSVYADNGFSGIDRISDTRQITFGAATRLVDPATGVETARLGVAQRYQFAEQAITPDGAERNTRFSDLMLWGAGRLAEHWRGEAAVQFSPENDRVARSVLALRWQPAPFQTLSATYRYARGLSEQMELGWQWPLWQRRAASGSGCGSGTLYGVGRVNYSMRESRLTDALAGVEWDAGCWIARVVAQRTSTGIAEGVNRLMLQLELVGLSRLGSNPLQTLKDNIPGYRLLRDDPDALPTAATP